MTRKTGAVLISIIAVAGLTGLGYYVAMRNTDDSDAILDPSSWRGHDLLNHSLLVPDWSFTIDENYNITMNELRGKVTVIDFMATWCSACEIQNGNTLALYLELSGTINLLSLTIDSADTLEELEAYRLNNGLTWPHGIDNGFEAAIYCGVMVVPTIVVIDADGLLRWVHDGVWNNGDSGGMNTTIIEIMAQSS